MRNEQLIKIDTLLNVVRCGAVDAVQKMWPPDWLKYAHMTIQPENLQNP